MQTIDAFIVGLQQQQCGMCRCAHQHSAPPLEGYCILTQKLLGVEVQETAVQIAESGVVILIVTRETVHDRGQTDRVTTPTRFGLYRCRNCDSLNHCGHIALLILKIIYHGRPPSWILRSLNFPVPVGFRLAANIVVRSKFLLNSLLEKAFFGSLKNNSSRPPSRIF